MSDTAEPSSLERKEEPKTKRVIKKIINRVKIKLAK